MVGIKRIDLPGICRVQVVEGRAQQGEVSRDRSRYRVCVEETVHEVADAVCVYIANHETLHSSHGK